jgi:hypothetical protein
LLTEEIVKISSFERSFSTSFGQGPIEAISEIIAEENGYETKRSKETMVNVFKGAVDEIERISSALRDGVQKPNWEKELQVVTSFNRGDTIVRRVISDLWIKKEDKESFFSIKTVTPNLDQAEKAKKDLLLLKADNISYGTFFALYYNPHGPKRTDYHHNFALKLFDIHHDSCVLIGEDYWNYLGGEGTYQKLLDVFSAVGEETKNILLSM